MKLSGGDVRVQEGVRLLEHGRQPLGCPALKSHPTAPRQGLTRESISRRVRLGRGEVERQVRIGLAVRRDRSTALGAPAGRAPVPQNARPRRCERRPPNAWHRCRWRAVARDGAFTLATATALRVILHIRARDGGLVRTGCPSRHRGRKTEQWTRRSPRLNGWSTRVSSLGDFPSPSSPPRTPRVVGLSRLRQCPGKRHPFDAVLEGSGS